MGFVIVTMSRPRHTRIFHNPSRSHHTRHDEGKPSDTPFGIAPASIGLEA
jgi:hypothetical protein